MRIYVGEIERDRIVLAGGVEAGEFPVFHNFGGTTNVDIIERARAKFVEAKSLGNTRHVVEFSVEREHESVEAANTFFLTHAMELQGLSGTFVFVSEDAGREADFFLHDAVLENVSFKQPLGVSTHATYRIVGGRITETND